jgi:hypothetical protein
MSAIDTVVTALANGVKTIRKLYREFKVWVANAMIAALAKGWTAALTIVGLVAVSIVVGWVWQIMKQNAIVAAVLAFIKNVGDTIKRFAALIQLDLIMSLMALAVMFDEKLYAQLSPLYDELGNFAEELELDFSYFNAFLEVDRAILQATSQLTSFGFVKAGADFVTGLSGWLKKLGKRMSDYAADPQLIFTDIQEAITAERIKDANEALGKIWAAINFAGDWVRDKGQVILTAIDEIDAARQKLPAEIQDAIAPWYKDAIAKVRDFEEKRWDPFWKQYNDFSYAISDMFLMYGTDIANIQRHIEDPMDWLRTLFALPLDEQATLKGTFDEFVGNLFPKAREAREAEAKAIADSMAEWEATRDKDVALLGAVGEGPKASTLPEVKPPAITVPWYKEIE